MGSGRCRNLFDELKVCVSGGDGVVARTPLGIMLILPGGMDELVDDLLELFDKASSEAGTVARALSLRLGGLLADAHGAGVLAFGLAVADDEGVALLLHGPVQARIRGGGAEQLLRGRDAAGLVDRIILQPFEELALEPDGSDGLTVRPHLDLERGTVSGGGVVLVQRRRPAAAVEPAVGPPVAASVVAAPLVAPSAEVSEVPSEGPLVEGISCENDHFNHPLARFCSRCGQGMFDRTPAYVQRPRPVLGALVLDSGQTLPLDADVLVGAAPKTAEAQERTRALVLSDPGGSVAAEHAAIRLVGWDVTVVDLGTPHGTHVWPPGANQWRRLEPSVPLVIPSGTSIAVGQRTLTYSSNHH
jgi:hypothetical protein